MPNRINPACDGKYMLECNHHLKQSAILFELQLGMQSTQTKISNPEKMVAYCKNLQAKLVEHTNNRKTEIDTSKLDRLLARYINQQIQTLQQAASQNAAIDKNTNPSTNNLTSTHEALSTIEEAMSSHNHIHTIEAVYLYLLMHDNGLDKPQTEHVINNITTYIAVNTDLTILPAQHLQPYNINNCRQVYFTRKVTRIITLLALTLPLAYAASTMLSSNLSNLI